MCKCSETPQTGEKPCGCQSKKRSIFFWVFFVIIPLGTVIAGAYWLYKNNKIKLPINNG